jgi:hypothetical protein
MRVSKLLAVALFVAISGCGEQAEREKTVALEQIPAEAMAAATKALPDIKFERAQIIKVDGKEVYEIRGKNKSGKIKEVEVTASGEVVEIE